MSLITYEELDLVRQIARLVDCNPFDAERHRLEKRVLGKAFVADAPSGHAGGAGRSNPNAEALGQLAERLAAKLRKPLVAKARPELELADYHRLVVYVLLRRYAADWSALIEPLARGP